MAAAADAALVLNRDGHGLTLYGRGRDINEFKLAVELKPDGQTLLIGDADEARRSQHQRAILKALREEKLTGRSPVLRHQSDQDCQSTEDDCPCVHSSMPHSSIHACVESSAIRYSAVALVTTGGGASLPVVPKVRTERFGRAILVQ
jgi:hypothetical protein